MPPLPKFKPPNKLWYTSDSILPNSTVYNSGAIFPNDQYHSDAITAPVFWDYGQLCFGLLCDMLSSTGMLPGNTAHQSMPNTTCLQGDIIHNGSLNETGTLSDISRSLEMTELDILFLLLVLMMIVMTFVGNTFVIASVRLERRLQTPTNYLTLSLAFTDLLVAVLVMPLSVVNVVSHDLVLIPAVCHLWIILDVNLCSVSIFHLLVIAVDRYRSVTNINYQCKRSTHKIFGMIALCWCVGWVICGPLIFGVTNPKYDPSITGECLIDQSVVYTLFSTVFAFYIPAIAMVTIYYNIYRIARSSIRKTYFKKLLSAEEKKIRRSSAPECLNSSKRRHRASFANIRYHFGRARASLDSSRSRSGSSHGSLADSRVQCGISLQSFDSSHVHCGRYHSRTSLDSTKMSRSSISSNSRRSPHSDTSYDTDSGYTDCRSRLDNNHEQCSCHRCSSKKHRRKLQGSIFDKHRPNTCASITDHGEQTVSSRATFDNRPGKLIWHHTRNSDRREKSRSSRASYHNHRETVGWSRASFEKNPSDTAYSRASIDGYCVSYIDSNFVTGQKSSPETSAAIAFESGQISQIHDQPLNPTVIHRSPPERRGAVFNDQKGIQMFTIGKHANFKENSTRFAGHRSNVLNLAEEKRKHESRRERRAARTLGIITGAFIMCWLPFFIIALISPLMKNSDVTIPLSVQTFVLWLGYFNCLVNPIIYTVFNQEFRKAFKKLVFCRYCTKRRFH